MGVEQWKVKTHHWASVVFESLSFGIRSQAFGLKPSGHEKDWNGGKCRLVVQLGKMVCKKILGLLVPTATKGNEQGSYTSRGEW